MARMWQERIADMTYRKRPGDDWPQEEFTPYEVRLVGGEVTTMLLAERGVFLGGVIWVREFRRLTATGHQTSIVTMVYRAETAMAHTMEEKLARTDDARALLRSIYTTEANLIPNEAAGTLTVRLHNMSSRIHDAAVGHLSAELNDTETVYPGTNLRLVYELVSSRIPGNQEF